VPLDLRSKFFARLDDLSETSSTYVVSGFCVDYAEYKNIVGKLSGLQQARQEFQEIWGKLSQDAEEDWSKR